MFSMKKMFYNFFVVGMKKKVCFQFLTLCREITFL